MTWTLVVPVKVVSLAKTRLAGDLDPGERVALVRAMVLDTLAAACATSAVSRVLVVTDDQQVVTDLRATHTARVGIVPEPVPAQGLNAAIRAGIAHARSTAPVPVAVLLGDLPALRPEDLDAALLAASRHALGVVVDADGTGTTLLTAAAGVELIPAFGVGSAAEHRRRGHVELDVPVRSGLRHDVDVLTDLVAVAALGPGPRTAEVLAGLVGRLAGV
ncbi:2-phospho-L-lactate guanylyltransferase [Sanguibacter sp. 25GB23B1]|uniref:2-phospho-L-lactate guanylyltransferase n=1 Tax=unclassified Sanguibacter TaxID=2645534 RepID=UPI0032AFF5CC